MLSLLSAAMMTKSHHGDVAQTADERDQGGIRLALLHERLDEFLDQFRREASNDQNENGAYDFDSVFGRELLQFHYNSFHRYLLFGVNIGSYTPSSRAKKGRDG
jgi:hypothetical protein